MGKFLTRDYWTFWRVFWFWMGVAFAASLLDAWVLHAPWYFGSLVRAGVGITLLLYPVYPESLEWETKYKRAWSPERCRAFIRIVAALEILFSFWVRITVR